MTRRHPRILLQTTIRRAQDDWNVGCFSLLADVLREVGDVVARDLEPDERGDDLVLSRLDRSRFDQAWLLGVDGGVIGPRGHSRRHAGRRPPSDSVATRPSNSSTL
jgi:hypothetical protein